MSVTAKEQFEDAIAENARLRRELDAAQTEAAEARGNVEKALRELSEEVAKRHKAERQCAEMRDVLKHSYAWDMHFYPYTAVQHALSTDCGKDYVPKAELEKALYDVLGRNRELTTQRMEITKLSQIMRQLVEALDRITAILEVDTAAMPKSDAAQARRVAVKALQEAKSLEVL